MTIMENVEIKHEIKHKVTFTDYAPHRRRWLRMRKRTIDKQRAYDLRIPYKDRATQGRHMYQTYHNRIQFYENLIVRFDTLLAITSDSDFGITNTPQPCVTLIEYINTRSQLLNQYHHLQQIITNLPAIDMQRFEYYAEKQQALIETIDELDTIFNISSDDELNITSNY